MTLEYQENCLSCEDYRRLRESAGWFNFSAGQAENALHGSRYIVTAVEGAQTVGMGRLLGDGMYFMIADVVVQPAYQGHGIGSHILQMLLSRVDRETPPGGRSSIQLIAEPGKEAFYEKLGFKKIPHEFCGSGMRKVIRK